MTLGEIIKNYRTEHKMSMDGFASISGMSKAYISLLEKNRHPKTGKPITPSIPLIKQAADAMHVDFNELFALIDGDIIINSSEQDFNIIFSKNLKAYLSEFDMTQADLAARLGVSTQSVSNWCKGAKSPRMDKVDAMCKIFHCKRSDLIEDKSDKDQFEELTYSINNGELKSLIKIAKACNENSMHRLLAYAEKLLDLQKMDEENRNNN